MIFYDFEVFECDWLIKAIDPQIQKIFTIWNDADKLFQLYTERRNDVWVGCNNLHYDKYIKSAILCGINPKKVSDFIINENGQGWAFSNCLRNFQNIEYDVLTRIDRGLKVWEGFLGHEIKESSVPFDINRPLTESEKAETEKYCESDVMNTISVFIERKADFDAIYGLIKMFPETLTIKDLSRTKAQISSKILGCERTERNDEFDLSVLPCIDTGKYKTAEYWFLNPSNHWYKKIVGKRKFENKLVMRIAGLDHTIGWGGIHAGKEKYINRGNLESKQIWHIDVVSFYPRLMIFHNLLTRNAKYPERFKMIFDKRIELKKAGKKKEQAPLKIVINGTFGISKAKTSDAYDPRNANLICVNGQLMIIDLINKLEAIDGFELIQSNTDGLIVSIPNTDSAFEQMDDICFEWESRCNMELEFDSISLLYQKDVNNYAFKFSNGKIETKGAYVKSLSALDYDLPIVNKAVVDYLFNSIPVEKTIYDCNYLMEFQQIKKIGDMYDAIYYNGHKLSERVIRCFASVDGKELRMKHGKKNKLDKLPSTPEKCFLHNGNVEGLIVPSNLDKEWYVSTAIKRLKDFGVLQ